MDHRNMLVLIAGLAITCSTLLQPGLCRPHRHQERCKIENIPTQENFDLRKFTGKWYDIARTTLKHENGVLRSGSGFFTVLNGEPILRYTYSARSQEGCIIPIVATGYQITNAKMFLKFESIENSFLRGNFWVVKTDYLNYALIYGCNQLRDDGHCHHRHELVYLISRTPDLSSSIMLETQKTIQDTLCVDINQLVVSTHEENCFADEDEILQDDPDVTVEEPVVEDETSEDDEVKCPELTDCDVDSLGCEHGLKQDESGCDTCACHICGPVCLMRCEHGFTMDERNCSQCRCAEAPDVTTETVVTEEDDTNNAINSVGHEEIDQNEEGLNETVTYLTKNKKVIEVDPNAVQPEFLYDIQPINTQQQNDVQTEVDATENEEDTEKELEKAEDNKDENNINDIDIKVEAIPECSSIMCPKACEHGFMFDENGCETCECFRCAIPMCANRCEYGYQLSPRGCETCDCNPAPATQTEPITCHPLNCHVNCTDGFKKDENGCDICRCIGCSDFQCALYCPHGYKQNAKGCQYCECRQVEHADADVCKVESVQAVSDLDMDKIEGEWRTLASAYSGTNKFVIRLEKAVNGMRTLYRNILTDGCGPTLRGSWTSRGNRAGDFYAMYGFNSGPSKVVHVTKSYDYMITYHCFHVRPDDGTCDKQRIDILGRNGDFPEEVKEELLSKLPSSCAGPDDFVQLAPSEGCHIRPSNEPIESCKIADLLPQKPVRWPRFEGRWYSVAKLYNRDVDQSGEYLIEPAEDRDEKLVRYRGSRNGICRDISEALIVPDDDGSGAFAIHMGKVRARGMLIYTDNNNIALYYECGEKIPTGECKNGTEYVEVMHRENHAPSYLKMVYGRILEDVCVNPENMVTVDHTVRCPVKEVCKISEIPSQRNFNSTAFAGTWHSVAKLGKSNGWDHVIAQAIAVDQQVVIHYTGTKDRECQPSSTAVLSPLHPSHPAHFTIQAGRRTALVKIVYTNYNVALVYECQSVGADNRCETDQEFLDVLSKDAHGFTQENLEELEEHLNSACVQKDEMQLSSHHVDCPLESDTEGCVVADLPIQKDFRVDMHTGRWYGVMSDFTSSFAIRPSVRQVTLLPDNHLIHSIVSIRDGECVNQRTLIQKADSDDWSLAKYSLMRGKFVKPHITVAYSDNETMITYSCNEIDQRGVCLPDKMSVFVSSRERSISDEKKESLIPVLNQLCVNPDTLISYSDDVDCEIQMSTSPSCQVVKTPILKKFDIKKAMGKWYVVSRTKGSAAPDALVLELKPGTGEHIIAKYTGYRDSYCMEPKEFELQQQHEPEEAQLFIKYANKVNGIVRVIFADDSHMMLYECGLISNDGSCAGGQASIEILNRVAEPLESGLQYQLTKRLSELCIDVTELEPVPHDVSCENFMNDCETRPVPSQENFDITAFMGKWYSIGRLKTSTPWESGAVNFTLREDGNVEVVHVSSRQGRCIQSEPSLLEPAGNGNLSEWKLEDHYAVKVVYTDYNNVAIVHECHHPNVDGSCPTTHRHIDVLSRDPDGPVEETKKRLGPTALSLCVRRRDFRKTSKPGLCKIEQHCSVDQLPLQEDLNPYMLLGEWYSYARKKGSFAPNSSKYLITRADAYGRKLKMIYSGTRKGLCRVGEHSEMEARTDEPSKFTLTHEENGEIRTGEMTVLYADENHALIHECYDVHYDGSCTKSDTNVEIITRNKQLSPEAREHILKACTRLVLNWTTWYYPYKKVVDCTIPIPGKSCGYQNAGVHPNFDYRSIMGRPWYTRARLVPGEKAIWSGVGHFEFAHVDSHTIQIAWASSEMGENGTSQCFSDIHDMERLSSDADLVGVYYHNIVETKVLFADEHLLILFDCKINEAGCEPNEKEIVINQREREAPLSPAAINFVKDVIRTQTCENPDILEILRVPDPCPSPPREEIGRLCYQNTIAAQEDLDLTKISGLWFQVARANTAIDVKWDAGVFHLSILDPETLRIQFTGRSRYDEESCLPVLTVDAYPDKRQPATMGYSSQRFKGQNGLMKIIHADDEVLIIYECLPGGLQDNGLCSRVKEHVEIYARRARINSKNFKKIDQILHDKTCFTDHDLIMSNRTFNCALSDHGDVRYSATSCKVHHFPTVANLNYNKFSGLWYEIERTQYQDTSVKWSSTIGNRGKLWEAAVLHYDAIRDNVFNYTYAGYTLRDGLCQGPFVAHTHPATTENIRSGHMHIFPGHPDAHGGPWLMHGVHKIVWSDYEEAVVYICFSEYDDGTCRKDTEFVSIISRNTQIDNAKLVQIHNKIKSTLCVDISEFVRPHQDYEKCLSTLGIDLKYSTDEGSGDKDECNKVRCRMACPHGFMKDNDGCEICRCIVHTTEDNGSGSGSEIAPIKEELGSGADETVRTEEESSGQEQKESKELSEEEREILNEIEKLSRIGH